MHNPGKFLLILSYLFLGAYLALFFPWRAFPKLFQFKNDTPNQPLNSYTSPKHYPYYIAIFIGLSVCALAPWMYVLASFLVCVLLYYSRAQADKKNAALIFTGLMFSSFLPVWLHNEKNRLELSIWQITIFLGITIAVYLLWNVANTFKKSDRSKYQTNLVNAVFIALLLVVYSMSITV